MKLKQIALDELLALFAPDTHEQIRTYWNSPSVHFIVGYANNFQPDYCLTAVGPGLEHTSLERAGKAIIDRKFARIFVATLHNPKGHTFEPEAATPAACDKKAVSAPIRLTPANATSAPFTAAKTTPATAPAKPQAAAQEPVATASASAASPTAVSVSVSVSSSASPEERAELDALRAALDKREAKLAAIEAELKQREEEVLEREEYVTQSEESLIEKIQKQERRSAELEQQEENIKKQLAKIKAAEAPAA